MSLSEVLLAWFNYASKLTRAELENYFRLLDYEFLPILEIVIQVFSDFKL